MFEQIKKAMTKSNVSEMKEFVRLQKSMDNFDKSIESARAAVVRAIENGDQKTSSKMKYIAEALNVGIGATNTSKSVNLDGDMTNKRPESITFMGKTVETKSWRAVSEAVLNILYENDKTVFSKLVKEAGNEKSPYLSRSSDGMKAPVMLGSGRGAIYADVSKVTNNDFLFLKKIMSAANVNQNELIINIDPTYYRKPVVRKKKVEDNKSTEPKRRGRPKKTA